MRYSRPTNALLAGITTFVLGMFLAVAKTILGNQRKRGKKDDEVGR